MQHGNERVTKFLTNYGINVQARESFGGSLRDSRRCFILRNGFLQGRNCFGFGRVGREGSSCAILNGLGVKLGHIAVGDALGQTNISQQQSLPFGTERVLSDGLSGIVGQAQALIGNAHNRTVEGVVFGNGVFALNPQTILRNGIVQNRLNLFVTHHSRRPGHFLVAVENVFHRAHRALVSPVCVLRFVNGEGFGVLQNR